MKTSNQDRNHDLTSQSATTKKNTSSRQKRVLVASIILAAVITIGGTFAWFQSTDEVTNKLTASSDYGVSIVEDFTPPQSWVPGQVVKKQVGVTNTGNLDAFVKLTISNFIDITVETAGVALISYNSSISYTSVTDENLTNAVELKTSRNNSNPDNGNMDSQDEVEAIQAGGRLVYAPFYDNTVLKEEASNGETVINPQDKHIINNTQDQIVGTSFDPNDYVDFSSRSQAVTASLRELLHGYNTTTDGDTGSLVYPIDTTGTGSNPTMTGLYVWERAVEATTTTTDGNATTTYTYSYAGYYYDASTNKYYAVDLGATSPTNSNVTTTNTNTPVDPVTGTGQTYTVYYNGTSFGSSGSSSVTNDQTKVITSLKANLVQTKTYQNQNLTFDTTITQETSDTTKGGSYVTATWCPSGTHSSGNDDIKIKIYFTEDYSSNKVGECWTASTYASDNITTHTGAITSSNTANQLVFYYNYLLGAGTTVPTGHQLISNVELDSSTSTGSYITFDYNLSIKADSIQAVPDADNSIYYKSGENDSNYVGSASAVNSTWASTDGQMEVSKIEQETETNSKLGNYKLTWTAKSSTE